MKAIKYLEYLSKGRGRAGSAIVVDREIIEYDDVITELQAYKAKIEELKECCKTQILLNDEKFIEAEMPEKSAYYQGLSRGYQNMLDSLEKNT